MAGEIFEIYSSRMAENNNRIMKNEQKIFFWEKEKNPLRIPGFPGVCSKSPENPRFPRVLRTLGGYKHDIKIINAVCARINPRENSVN